MGDVRKEEVKECGETKSSSNTADQKSCKGGSSASNFSLSDSELTLSDSEISKEMIEDIACRESIRLLMGNIEEKQAGIKQSKGLIRDIDKDLRDANEIVRGIEGRINEVKDEHGKYQIHEKILRSNIEDLDSELNELFIFTDYELYHRKMHQMKKGLIENSGIHGVLKKKIESLKEQCKEIEILNNAKNKEYKELTEYLSLLKEKIVGKKEMIKTSITNKDHTNYIISSDSNTKQLQENYYEVKIGISKCLEKVSNTESIAFNSHIKQLLKEIQIKNSKAESRIGELKNDYLARKYEIIEQAKIRKETLITLIKNNNDAIYTNFYEQTNKSKDFVRYELKNARELEHRYHSTNMEFDRTLQKCVVMPI